MINRLLKQLILIHQKLKLSTYNWIKNWIPWSGTSEPQTTDTRQRHKSKISEKLGRCGRQNMLWSYLKIWELIFGCAVKAISSLGVRSPCYRISFITFPVSHLHAYLLHNFLEINLIILWKSNKFFVLTNLKMIKKNQCQASEKILIRKWPPIAWF